MPPYGKEETMRLAALALLAAGTAAFAQDPSPPEETPPVEEPAPAEAIPIQEPPAEPPPAEPVTLDALRVTAQRRVQRLVDVPVAVTALTQDQVEARGISRLDDLNSIAPGLQVSRSPSNTTISQLTIRGSSQINPAIYWDPAVGVYLDGVYIGKGQGAIFDIVDLSSVEVLRGPQGTLYGRNTIAGTINFVTRDPSGQFGGTGAVELGNFGGRVYRANLNLPTVGERLDLAVGARKEERDPWIDTTPTSPVDGMNDRDNQGFHVGALVRIVDGLEAVYHLDASETDQTNNFLQLYRYTDQPTCTTDCMAPYISRRRRDTADINAPSVERADILGHSLIVSWDAAGWLTVKSISGYRETQWLDRLDLDGSPNDVAHSTRDTDYDQTSQDLNLSGQVGAFHYTAGAYYFADNGFTNNPIFVSINGAPVNFDSRYGTHARAEALYGQVDWQALERLTLTAGARRTSEKKELDRVFGFSPDPTTVPYTYYIPEDYDGPEKTFTATTPMAAVAYRWTDWLNTYARYAEGFKSGGFNGEYSNIQSADPFAEHERETTTPFRPEQQRSIELGAKGSFLAGRAVLSVAAFRNKLEDLQVSIFTASGAAASVIRNAGKATVEGFEIEAAVMPWDGTTLRAHYALLDPVYDEFIDAVCTGPNNTQCADENVANNRAFVHAPETAWNLAVDSDLWATTWGTLRATADYAWTDEFFTYPYQLTGPADTPCNGNPTVRPCYDSAKQSAPDTRVPAYGVVNAKLSLVAIPLGSSRMGEVSLWGRNVLDEDSVNNFIDFGPGFQNLTVANFVEPRAVGVTALLRF
jgi:iron complex outermembrane recepter protein